jgi:hypothetical protein
MAELDALGVEETNVIPVRLSINRQVFVGDVDQDRKIHRVSAY